MEFYVKEDNYFLLLVTHYWMSDAIGDIMAAKCNYNTELDKKSECCESMWDNNRSNRFKRIVSDIQHDGD